jgi:hypothetical protein
VYVSCRVSSWSRKLRPSDGDDEALKTAGHSEDEIFEQTVSAAVAAGLLRRAAGLKVLGLETRR